MPWGAAIALAGTVYAADKQSDAAGDAASAGGAASQAAIEEQRRRDAQYQQNIQPYLTMGTNALGTIGALNAGDIGAFRADPGYQFRMDQSLKGLDRTAAAQGSVSGGGADADRIALAGGLADQGYSDYYSRLMNLATMGQNAAVGAGSMGQQSASNIGNLLGQGAAAQGAGAIGSANAWSNAASGLAGLAGQYMGARQSSYGQPSSWGAPAGGSMSSGAGGSGMSYTAPTTSTGGNWMNAYGYGG